MKNWIFLLLILGTISCKNETNEASDPEKTETIVASTTFDPTEIAGEDYFLDDQHSYIGFKIKYFGFSPVRGRFNTFDGAVFYDPNAVANTSMTLFIDVNSINTGNERRDKDLITGEGWFNETEYPHISFRSKKTEVNEDGSFQLIGDFTMNGVTKEMSIPFDTPTKVSRDYAANEQVDFSGELSLNRKDYGVNGDEFWDTVLENGLTQLSNAVEIELDIHTRRGDYLKRYEDLEPDNVRKIILDEFANNGLDAGMSTLITLSSEEESKVSSGALTTIGNTLISRNNHEAAREVFKYGANAFPEKESFQINTAVVYLLLQDRKTAKEYLYKALEMNPTNAKAVGYLSLLSDED